MSHGSRALLVALNMRFVYRLRSHLPALAAVVVLSLSGCGKEDDTPAPQPTPAPDARAAFLGNWNVTDSLWIDGSLAEVRSYVLPITTGGTVSDTLIFNNLWNDGAAYRALLSGDAFSFPSQQVSGPYYMSGNGTRNGDQLFYQTTGDLFLHRGHGLKQ
jgi:hypothetical protein